jgi:predicted secreted hydrolase
MDSLEKEKRNYLAYFEGTRGAVRNPSNYQRRDDASHIYHNDKNYSEWWYFDASFTNGYHIVVTYHYRNFFLPGMPPSLQFFVYRPDGSRVDRYELCKAEEVSADPNYCDVRMGKSWVRDFGDHYRLVMDIRGDGYDLIFKNTVPPWKPGTGYNYKNEENGKAAGWVVPVPAGRVEGSLHIKGETIPVEGYGYHDHNWGNFHTSETFRGWHWGRVHTDRYAIDWGWVLPRDRRMPVVSPLLLARPGEITLSTDELDVLLDDFVVDEKLGQRYPRKVGVHTDTQGVTMDLRITTKRMMEQMKLPKVTEWDQYYLRFLADFSLDVRIDGVKDAAAGEMLHEYVIMYPGSDEE